MDEIIKNRILNLVSTGKLQEAITLLTESINQDNAFFKDLLILNSYLNNLQNENRKGVINSEEYLLSTNKITSSFLHILNQISYLNENEKIRLGRKIDFRAIFKDKIIITSFVISVTLSLIYFLYQSSFKNLYISIFPAIDFFKVTITMSSLLLLFKSIYNYLNIGQPSASQINNQQFNIPEIKVEDIAKNIVLLDEKSKKELLDKVNAQLTGNVIEAFKLSVEDTYRKEIRYEKVIENFSKNEIRITDEIKSLNRKANINLSIGVITTIMAVLFLVYISLSFVEKYDSWLNFVSHYIPRLTLVVFIEIFSFYFLKLYRTNLNEIQYYQNEMTSIEFKAIALKTALLSNDEENIKFIINEFIKVDYNKVMKKDETTVEIERHRAENEYNKVVLERIFDHFNINTILGSNHKTTEKSVEPNK